MAHAQTNPTYPKPVQVSKSTKLAFIEAGTGGRQLSLHSRSAVRSIPASGLSGRTNGTQRTRPKNTSQTIRRNRRTRRPPMPRNDFRLAIGGDKSSSPTGGPESRPASAHRPDSRNLPHSAARRPRHAHPLRRVPGAPLGQSMRESGANSRAPDRSRNCHRLALRR